VGVLEELAGAVWRALWCVHFIMEKNATFLMQGVPIVGSPLPLVLA
jgi:hypothetical protein